MARMFVTLDQYDNRDVILITGRRLYERFTVGNPGIYLGINYRDSALGLDEIAEVITTRLANNYMTVDEIANGVETLDRLKRLTMWKELNLPYYANEFYFDVIKRYYVAMEEIIS